MCELVKIPSVSGSEAENYFPEVLLHKLAELKYFQEHPDLLNQVPTGDGRFLISAFVRAQRPTSRTVILFSHFDVVDVHDYGKWKDIAFDPELLTQRFNEQKKKLPQAVQKDLDTGNWIFGRGTMDMKSGLTLHMSLIEAASEGRFEGNVLLVSVPDEEVNSVGMRAAIPHLLQLKERNQLEFVAAVNSEPMFSLYPGDQTNYLYTGSVGKVMPGFLCYGKETHVGEPYSGLNGNLMASFVTEAIELNTDLCDQDEGRLAPPPTNLIQKGLKDTYSVQIPHRAVTLFNLFMLERSIEEVTTILRKQAEQAAAKIESFYHKEAERYSEAIGSTIVDPKVRVLSYEELLKEACKSYGGEKVDKLIESLIAQRGDKDDRGLSIEIVDQLAILCKALAPMIILFYTPPFYPAVHSHHQPMIRQVVDKIQSLASKAYHTELIEQHYFSGISDLSYIGMPAKHGSMNEWTANMPIWDRGYSIPFAEMEQLAMPVLNLGPIGRDPHQWTERLDVDFSFVSLKELLSYCISEILAGDNHK
nr:M20/M25/M40 family metallo-hydrolase [Sporolactobacillus kofuensis]